MFITSLEEMEEIVRKNSSLSWDGWTVVFAKYNPTAWRKPNAKLIKGKWHETTRYEPGYKGWNLPKSIKGKNG